MDIMTTLRMPVLHMDITDQTTLRAAHLSVPGHGSRASTGTVVTGAVEDTGVIVVTTAVEDFMATAGSAVAISMAAGSVAEIFVVREASMVVASEEETVSTAVVVDSTAVVVDSTVAVEAFTAAVVEASTAVVVAGSTAVAAAGSTVVVEADHTAVAAIGS